MRFVWFFIYYKTTNRIAPCDVVHCYLRCGVVQFVQFSYYKTANHSAPFSVMRYDYAILWAILVRFGEHSYLLYVQVR